MKIGITGAHGTGKSTLSYLLGAYYRRHGRSVCVVQEIVRSCPWPLHKESTPETCMWIYHAQAKAELESIYQHDMIICDRTVYDPFVYAYHFGLTSDDIKESSDMAFESLVRYDKVIFVRPDMPLQADKIRSLDVNFQTEIDRIFAERLQWVKHIQVYSSAIFSLGEEWKKSCL